MTSRSDSGSKFHVPFHISCCPVGFLPIFRRLSENIANVAYRRNENFHSVLQFPELRELAAFSKGIVLMLGLRLLRWWLWRVMSSGLWRRVVRRKRDVSEEHVVSIFGSKSQPRKIWRVAGVLHFYTEARGDTSGFSPHFTALQPKNT
jgi:hypothetical protein